MTLNVRVLTGADIEAAGAVLDLAYGRPPGSYNRSLRRDLSPAATWLLAVLGGRPVGVVGGVDYGPFAYLGAMGVHPEARRRGVGLALMESVLAWLDGRGCPLVLLDATPAGAPLYEHFGFTDADTVARYGLDAALVGRPTEPEPATGGRTRQAVAEDLPVLVRLDAAAFGAERPAVLRAHLAENPGRTLVALSGEGEPTGFLVAQPQTLGPWVAEDGEAAEALLEAALALSSEGPPAVIVPGGNPAAGELLLTQGFRAELVLRHMRRGGASRGGNRATLYGQASFALG